jgi:hypothetical protein
VMKVSDGSSGGSWIYTTADHKQSNAVHRVTPTAHGGPHRSVTERTVRDLKSKRTLRTRAARRAILSASFFSQVPPAVRAPSALNLWATLGDISSMSGSCGERAHQVAAYSGLESGDLSVGR